MKAISFLTLTALGIALTLTTTGCHPENMSTIHGRPQPIAVDVNPQPPIIANIPSGTTTGTELPMTPLSDTFNHTNWIEDHDALKAYSVHFAYDSSAVRSADKSKVSSVADYLKSHAEAAVRVEGNCDERGTEEYNRSLGERRALGGREELIKLGITSDRVDTLSYGEDKPANDGHNESAWRENRRDDFVVLTPPGK